MCDCVSETDGKMDGWMDDDNDDGILCLSYS